MVSTSAPFACPTTMVQDFTARPFTCTVQQPHWLVSQPMCVPVSPSLSRRKSARSIRSSASPDIFLPLTVSSIFAMELSLLLLGRLQGLPDTGRSGRHVQIHY